MYIEGKLKLCIINSYYQLSNDYRKFQQLEKTTHETWDEDILNTSFIEDHPQFPLD